MVNTIKQEAFAAGWHYDLSDVYKSAMSRAMHFASLKIEELKPDKPIFLGGTKPAIKYNPCYPDVYGKWHVVGSPFTKTVKSESSGKTASYRLVLCDCECGRTLNKPVPTYRLCKGVTVQCVICTRESLAERNRKQ